MPNLKQIAQDPHNALISLEKELGVEPGALLQEMDRVAGECDDWKNHLPYLIAESYYEDDTARSLYEGHVNSCEYCKELLQTLHPSDLQVRDFTERATETLRQQETRARRGYLPVYSVSLAAVLLIVVTGFGTAKFLSLDDPNWSNLALAKERVVNDLSLYPGRLVALEASKNPAERFRAAKYYFAVEQPQLAYQQIGEGLELAGLGASDVHSIITAASIPFNESAAPVLSNAAQRLKVLELNSPSKHEPTRQLEMAVLQAKLGFHNASLESIRKYLETSKFDAELIAELPATAVANVSDSNTLRYAIK